MYCLPHCAELFLARSVQHVEDGPLSVDLGVLQVGVLDGGVVVGHEDLLEELDGERALPHPSVAHHHQLIRGQVVTGNGAGCHGDGYTEQRFDATLVNHPRSRYVALIMRLLPSEDRTQLFHMTYNSLNRIAFQFLHYGPV
uniref:Uncharacterized protein n=1 Tax=Anguilla anguilla TaxID=7936 RepID=A0A0E9UVL8_ANGAN